MLNLSKSNYKKEKIGVKVLVVLLFDLIYLIMIYLALNIPKLIINYYNEDRVGLGKAALYPVYYSNITYAVIFAILTVFYVYISYKYYNKNPESLFVVIYSFIFTAVIVFKIVSFFDMVKDIVNYREAIVRYEAGSINTFYGTIAKDRTKSIEGIFLKSKAQNDVLQIWRVDGLLESNGKKVQELYTSLNFEKFINIEDGKNYKITYLDGINIICNIEEDERKAKDFPVLLNNFANSYKNINESEELVRIVDYLKRGYYSPVSNGMLEKYPESTVEYFQVDINHDTLQDYFVTVTSYENNYKGIMLLLNREEDELYLDIYLDYNFYNNNFNASTLITQTYGLYDIKIQLEGEEEPLYFKYNLSRNFIKF